MPPDARPIEGDGLGVETPDGPNAARNIVVGNYLFNFHNFKPDHDQLAHVFLTVPHYSHAPLPIIPQHMPAGALPNSERYILGPESLAYYASVIPPSTAAFHFSSEAELADYPASKGKGKTTVVVFNFPGSEMAVKQLPAFEAIPGAMVKRAGPFIAIALHPASADDAERLLAQVKYQAEVTLSEKPPTLKDNPGNLMVNIAILCGVLIAFCVVSGLVFGGLRHLWIRTGAAKDADEVISLHLTNRQ